MGWDGGDPLMVTLKRTSGVGGGGEESVTRGYRRWFTVQRSGWDGRRWAGDADAEVWGLDVGGCVQGVGSRGVTMMWLGDGELCDGEVRW
jgi:hypothetical protein